MLKRNRLYLLACLGISALAFLPLVHKIGYLNDDWYLMFDGHVGGADFFHEVYRIDRPLRGYLMSAAFSLFGLNPLYYHLSAFLFRFLSGLGFFWLLDQMWPENRRGNFLATLLFLIYPGFLSQLNPIDYQSQIFSLACGTVSVALTMKAILSVNKPMRWTCTVLSILLSWVYLGLVEYFLGFEALRLVCVGVVQWRARDGRLFSRLTSTLRAFVPFLAGAGGFLIWRLFLFEAERRATDVSLQLSSLFSSPLTGLWWLNYLIQDFLNVLIVVWGIPMRTFAFPMRLRDAWIGIGLAMACALILLAVLNRRRAEEKEVTTETRTVLNREQVWVGILTTLAALLPVILVNRHIVVPDYSRYTLAPSVGAVLLIAVLAQNISTHSLRGGLAGLLVGISIFTHFGNSVNAANETAATRNFWWQVAWRVPDFKPGVTLIASYPGSALSEDYFVWGPANFIYYAEPQTKIPLEIELPAAILADDIVIQILAKSGDDAPLRRGNSQERDFGNVLVMIQTQPSGCVRLINGEAPELSSADQQRLLLIAPYSRLENVITEGEFHVPPSQVFGPEPARGWCYYYQKADLARQRRDWETIPALLKDALDQGHYPEDGLEWLPFLQASAVLGDVDRVRSTSKLVSEDKFMRLQVCEVMTEFMKQENLNEQVKSVVERNICK
jgi:hypothetical protein